MGIPRESIQRILDAGHPDQALIGVPVSLMREIFAILPVDRVRHVGATPPAPAAGVPA